MEEASEIMAKYPRFVDNYLKLQKEKLIEIPDLVSRDGWQTDLKILLNGTPDLRKIIWYCDRAGNAGKSYFARHYKGSKYIINGGKASDIYYAYNYEKVVFFDLARQKEEYVAYDVMENFKNGYFLSTKYEVKCVTFNTPHVIVFANFHPDVTKLSADRWDIRVI